jgi:NitT/TauT family transport system permease protein
LCDRICAEHTIRLVHTERFRDHALETLKAFGLAMAIAMAIGLAIGFWLGFHRFSGDVMEPMLVAPCSIPKITLYPILLLAFGLGMPAKVAFGAIHGIEQIRWVLLPASIPEIFTGLRVGFALTLIGTVLGEMFAARHGLGCVLMSAIGIHDIDVIMPVTFVIMTAAMLASGAPLALDHRLHRRV